jgi:hypothetical protein
VAESFGEQIKAEVVAPVNAVLTLCLSSSKAAVTLRQALVATVGSIAKVV